MVVRIKSKIRFQMNVSQRLKPEGDIGPPFFFVDESGHLHGRFGGGGLRSQLHVMIEERAVPVFEIDVVVPMHVDARDHAFEKEMGVFRNVPNEACHSIRIAGGDAGGQHQDLSHRVFFTEKPSGQAFRDHNRVGFDKGSV